MSDGDDVRGRLIQAAGPIFAEKGFAQATVREICAAAGANVASVNYYFGDKEKLYFETFSHAHRCRVRQTPLPVFEPDQSPEEKLRAFLRSMLQRLFDPDERARWEHELLLRELVQPTGIMEPLFEDFFRPMFNRLTGIVREFVGDAPSEADVHRLGYSILGQCLFYRVGEHIVRKMHDPDALSREFSSERVADHVFEFSRCALEGFAASAIRARDRPIDPAEA
jgi:AcrR family transcriptional regulator